MNIWFVTIGEPIPHSENKLRLHRTGILCKYISENSSSKVTWWTSNFNHFNKEHIFERETDFDVNPNLRLITLKGKGYKRNVSFDRIIDHKQIAKSFRKRIDVSSKPDIIIVAFPTLELCEICTIFGNRFNIPVLVDYRDMWPEVFLDITPSLFKPLMQMILSPLFNKTRDVFSSASGLIGITNEFLKLGLLKAGRNRNKYDAVFPLAYLRNQFSQKDIEFADLFWKEKLVNKSDILRICFFGTLGHQFDFDTILNAIELLNKENISDFEFVICGSGDKEMELKVRATKLKGLILPGYMGAAQIKSLLELSDVGLCPYNLNKAFLSSIPGKAIEYMSAGLPLLSTLENGELGKLIIENEIGFHYEFGNPISLANRIKDLIKNKSDINQLNGRIFDFYLKNFDAEIIYSNYFEHIRQVVINYNES
jgi:glycosyltransferase involved in cell wall biosynthesis